MDSFIDEFLKLKSYEGSRKRFQGERKAKNYDLKRFLMFVQKRRKFRQKSKLSFEVNLEIDHLKFASKPMNSVVESNKRKSRTAKNYIPQDFMKHILALGFQESDSHVLYENKDDWIGMQKGWLKLVILLCS